MDEWTPAFHPPDGRDLTAKGGNVGALRSQQMTSPQSLDQGGGPRRVFAHLVVPLLE